MISHHKLRDNGNGLDRVSEYILTYKCHRYHKFNQTSLQNLMMMYQMRISQQGIPHHHQLDHCHQLNREVAPPEETNDLDRVSEDLHIHPRMPASSHNLLYLLPEFRRPRPWQLRAQMKIQHTRIHKIALPTVQGHHKNKKSHGDRVHKKQKGMKTVAQKQPSELPNAKKHKIMDSDEDDEEPQNEPGTSSTSPPTVPVLRY